MAGPELLIISAGLQLAQGISAKNQGDAQADLARQTAQRNAQAIDQQSQIEKDKLQRQQRLFSGAQRTRAATTGATLESFEDTFEDTTQQSLLDVALLDYDTKVRRQQALFSGETQAFTAEQQGMQGLISGITGAVSTGIGVYDSDFGGLENFGRYKSSSAPIPGRKPF